MDAEDRRKSIWSVASGVLLKSAALGLFFLLQEASPFRIPLFWVLYVTGAVIFFLGCVQWARAKGRTAAVGLVAIFGLVAVVVLALLPDRSRDSEDAVAGEAVA
ncbi:MAG: hypothetical protein WBX15_20290 [Thermoanaerobaculia bacterium]